MQIWKTTLIAGAVAAALLGCTPPQSKPVAAIDDKVYAVTPTAMTVKAGIVTAEFTDIKVTERVEKGSDRVDSPARLSAKMKLVNSSQDQTVRLIGGKMVYIDTQGQPIKVGEGRTEPVIRCTSASARQLHRRERASQWIDVDILA